MTVHIPAPEDPSDKPARTRIEFRHQLQDDKELPTVRHLVNLFDENKKPMELSEGMKVKFNLLLALSHRAEVLILDEPTSGLDPFSRDELLDLLRTLKDHGVTILFSTHITSDLEKCADNIIYISRGEIRADCPKEDFMRDYGKADETLEEVFLRLEKEARA